MLHLLNEAVQLFNIAIRERPCSQVPYLENHDPTVQSVPLGFRKGGLIFALQQHLHSLLELMKIRPFLLLLLREREQQIEREHVARGKARMRAQDLLGKQLDPGQQRFELPLQI